MLLDGNSLLYRGFFAMRALTTASGQPTNAIYSLAMMLLLALEREKPDAVICAWDTPEPTFRHTQFVEYKAQRAEPPEELTAQRALSRELLRAFNIPMIDAPGWEADDIIGTLAEREKKAGNEVLIVTGDLDATQLVDDTLGPVRLMSTVKGVSETVIYDEAAVMARYGLTPIQIPDYKALKGDTSDNIPGLPGIGDKTATQLISEFGSVEALIENVDKVKSPKIQALVRDKADLAMTCKMLATICRDCPIPDGFEIAYDYKLNGPHSDIVRDLFERLEFRTIIRRIPQRSGGASPAVTPTEPTQPRPVSSNQGALDFDADPETTFAPAVPIVVDRSQWSASAGIVVGMTPAPDKAFLTTAQPTVVAIATPGGETGESREVAWSDIESIKAFLEDPAQLKIVHDTKLISSLLLTKGIVLRGVHFDPMLAAYLINAGRSNYRLPDIIKDQLGFDVAESDWQGLASALRGLEAPMRTRLVADGLASLHDDLELPLASVIAALEVHGVLIDSDWMRQIGGKLQEAIAEAEASVYELSGGEKFSIGSPKQLQVILFEKLKLPTAKKTKTGYSTDSEVLEGLAGQGYEVARKIVQWRELTKLKTQYADALPTLVSPIDGRIHTSLNQHVASTGRLSSTNPNLQNIPIRTEIGREIRKGFVAAPGNVLLAADYSQIELRIFAHITRDPELMRTFAADEDIHRRTAALVFGVDEADVTSEQRRRSKTINFAVIYGMGEVRLAAELGVDRATAGAWRKRYFDGYPGVKAYSETVLEFARENGYVKTLLGRRRYTPDILSRVAQFRTAAEREAANMPVQGTSADIIKLAMLRADKALRESGLAASMILQVHDELLFECPEGDVVQLTALVRDAMEGAFPLEDVPLRVEVKVGPNWAEMKQINR